MNPQSTNNLWKSKLIKDFSVIDFVFFWGGGRDGRVEVKFVHLFADVARDSSSFAYPFTWNFYFKISVCIGGSTWLHGNKNLYRWTYLTKLALV